MPLRNNGVNKQAITAFLHLLAQKTHAGKTMWYRKRNGAIRCLTNDGEETCPVCYVGGVGGTSPFKIPNPPWKRLGLGGREIQLLVAVCDGYGKTITETAMYTLMLRATGLEEAYREIVANDRSFYQRTA